MSKVKHGETNINITEERIRTRGLGAKKSNLHFTEVPEEKEKGSR